MKTSLTHLPAKAQRELAALTQLYSAEPAVEKLILFGSYARGDFVLDRSTGYISDYDVLVVVADAAQAAQHTLWHELEQRGQRFCTVPLTVIVHDIVELNQEIRRGRYFFVDVLRDGIALVDRKRLALAKPKALSVAERLQMAQHYYGYWYESASQFWRGVGYFMHKRELLPAAFLLHQSAERFLHTVLLVFTGYKPRTHDLEKLSNQAALLHPALRAALPRAAGEERRLFRLLKRAYIEARYSKSYRITLEELTALRKQVQDLAALVRTACGDEMVAMGADAEQVSQLQQPPQDGATYELPATPEDLTDATAVERWKEALLAASHARGVQEGEQRGRAEGLQEGEQRGRAAAIADVLTWRGVVLSEAERERIHQCRDEVLLRRWWLRARTVHTAQELFAEDREGV